MDRRKMGQELQMAGNEWKSKTFYNKKGFSEHISKAQIYKTLTIFYNDNRQILNKKMLAFYALIIVKEHQN